jgi:Transcription factor WhiB
MTTDKMTLSRITLDLQEAITDNGGVECEEVPDIFFPEDYRIKARQDFEMARMAEETAREICLRCPVMAKCLKVGMFEDYGIWGGATADQRKKIRRQIEV